MRLATSRCTLNDHMSGWDYLDHHRTVLLYSFEVSRSLALMVGRPCLSITLSPCRDGDGISMDEAMCISIAMPVASEVGLSSHVVCGVDIPA